MKRILLGIPVLVAVLVFFPVRSFGAMPRSATLATHAVGGLYNALGTGIGTVLSRHTPITVRVQPFAGPPAWLPSMDKGETDMGILTSADAITSYKGIVIYKRPHTGTRILISGGRIYIGFYVRGDSEIKTVSDLRGKKVPTDFPGIPIARLSSTATLASSGLTYNDIMKVPVSDLAAGGSAFLEGRLDAGWDAVGSPRIIEANSRIRGGIRFLPTESGPEAAKRMGGIYPGSYPALVPGGSATAVVTDTHMLTNDIYLVATKFMSDEVAYEIVKTLWERNEDLPPMHPGLKEWTRERMVNQNVFIPYHPGAVKFLKEKGVWSKEMDALQARLLTD
ncbi:MAG: TAXI family TRAP transporter solute-binding subunit [Deltaproteobacteria bacterium]|nr:TAXI family TRAP transporter solute-binding subunit [Deltaproteobacteria bacterium]